MEDFIWNKTNISENRAAQINTIANSFLNKYKYLDQTDRDILDLESALKFYYSDYIAELLGIYCYDKAYHLSTKASSKEAHLKAIAYYNKSIDALSNIVISYPKYQSVIDNARKGVKYSEHLSKQ